MKESRHHEQLDSLTEMLSNYTDLSGVTRRSSGPEAAGERLRSPLGDDQRDCVPAPNGATAHRHSHIEFGDLDSADRDTISQRRRPFVVEDTLQHLMFD